MLIYLASEYNQDRFTFLKEKYIMNTEAKVKLSHDTFMKCIKKELRNLEIHCLIIDLQIFDKDETIDFKQTLEAFSLLNPECKVIITYEDDGDLPESIASLRLTQDIHILKSNICNEEIIDIIEGVEQNPVIDDITEYSDPVIEDDTKEEEINISDNDLTDNREKYLPINIYDKVIAPVKISEGEPLRKKAKRLPEVIVSNRSSTVKYSTIMKRHQNNNDNLPPSPKMADDNKWNCSNFMIGIVGAERRSGTTAAAMHLANYLRDQGAVVIYTEANRHEHLVDIAKEYEFIQEEDHYIHNNVTYYLNSQFDQAAGSNFVIFDLGSLSEDKQRKEKILNEIMNEIIIVTGCKEYELEALNQAVMTLGNDNITILGNLVTEEEVEHLQEVYKGRAKTIAAAPYEPDLMMSGLWPDKFTEIFYTYLVECQAVS